ncbi:MAG TPA: copper amine oxidase N-terminal domain-containing protein, partial [Syntrophomonadaceae bacterium]|nr:copper amine oxidase N-terminal domain-containing protein [Syntrophomonadaceae bacterium]
MKLLVKNFWIGLICLILLFGLAGSAEASVVKFTIDSPQYSVDKAEYQMDAAPYIKDGRTYIPIRYVASVCGVKMDNIRYDGQT